MPTNDSKKGRGRGGARTGSGRPRKANPDDYIQVTCVLRRDTVEKLKEGAGGKQKFFGGFLQFHLDRFPIPSHEEYMAMRNRKPAFAVVARRRTPVIYGGKVGQARRAATRPRKRLSEAEAVRRKFLREFEPVKVA